MSNKLGHIFNITTFGESHGVSMGVVIDGCPAGVEIQIEEIQRWLDQRRPGQSALVSQRQENDQVRILSGVFEGKTTGMPIAILIDNEDARSKDYAHIKGVFRPSHADYTYETKYQHRDYRGGGRSSARETVSRVAAGAVAAQMLRQVSNIETYCYVHSVGEIEVKKNYTELDLTTIEHSEIRCPDPETAQQMIAKIQEIKKEGNTIGGTIVGVLKNVPTGLGEPVFDKFHAELGKAMLSINAVKGFEIGSGFEGTRMTGKEHNDVFVSNGGNISTLTNHSGGVQGGITNGQDIYFKVAFKPVATIMRDQESVDNQGNNIVVQGKGRHDPCVLPRAVPIVNAMANLVLADFWLRNKTATIND